MKKNASKNGKNILLGVTASISAYRACDLITLMRDNGYSVRPVLSKDAHHFITPLVLQTFAGQEVIKDFFSLKGRNKPVHIELAKEADLILVSPASADIIAKLTYGFAEDVLCCTVLASQAPLVVVPAMNEKMYSNAVTQENIHRLKARGAIIVPPIHGHLVCSDEGMGHIAEDETILKAVKMALSKKKK